MTSHNRIVLVAKVQSCVIQLVIIAVIHPVIAAMTTVPRVLVPDVRGLRLEDAEVRLRSAGFVPGTMSSRPGPGTVGTVWQQEPRQNTAAPRGTTFNLMLVALPDKPKSTAGENDDNDERFYRTVPKLIGLTPNQASNLLGRSHLQLGNVSKGTGSSSPGTIYGQKPEPGSLVKAGSRIDVGIADSPKPPESAVFVYVPNRLGQTEKPRRNYFLNMALASGVYPLSVSRFSPARSSDSSLSRT